MIDCQCRATACSSRLRAARVNVPNASRQSSRGGRRWLAAWPGGSLGPGRGARGSAASVASLRSQKAHTQGHFATPRLSRWTAEVHRSDWADRLDRVRPVAESTPYAPHVCHTGPAGSQPVAAGQTRFELKEMQNRHRGDRKQAQRLRPLQQARLDAGRLRTRSVIAPATAASPRTITPSLSR